MIYFEYFEKKNVFCVDIPYQKISENNKMFEFAKCTWYTNIILKNIVLFNNNVNTFIYILNTDCCYSILVNMKFKNSLYDQSGKKNMILPPVIIMTKVSTLLR